MQVLICAFLIALPLARSGAQRAAAVPQSKAVVFIARMYEEYSWETKDPYPPGRRSLFSSPASVLQRVFDAPLAKAILADRACEARTQGECKLSFDPMWNSQDPSGVTVRVVPTRDSMVVQVRLHYPYDNETRLVMYRVRATPDGLRIAEMSAPEWPSLLKLLQQPIR